MKFKLKSFSERKSTMLPRIATALLGFGIKWVLSIVIFSTFFCRKTRKINDFSQKQMIKKNNNILLTRGLKSCRFNPYAT